MLVCLKFSQSLCIRPVPHMRARMSGHRINAHAVRTGVSLPVLLVCAAEEVTRKSG